MRATSFFWGWKSYTPTPDPTMTRERLARLLRSWRRSQTQGRRDFALVCVHRESGKRTYRVSAHGYDDSETIVVAQTRCA